MLVVINRAGSGAGHAPELPWSLLNTQILRIIIFRDGAKEDVSFTSLAEIRV